MRGITPPRNVVSSREEAKKSYAPGVALVPSAHWVKLLRYGLSHLNDYLQNREYLKEHKRNSGNPKKDRD